MDALPGLLPLPAPSNQSQRALPFRAGRRSVAVLGDTTGPHGPSGFWFFLFLVEHTEQTKSASKQPDSGRRRLTCCDVDRYVRENKTRNSQ